MPNQDELDWDDLRYFLEAARATTLAGAARVLGIEHTTIGRRLSTLERALGTPLVLRGPDGLRLTAAGERALPFAEELERTVRALSDAVRSQSTRVRLALPSGFAPLFAAAHERLRAAQPGVVLELLSGAHRVDLERGEADLALRGGPIEDDALIARPLCESGWSLYASESYLARDAAPADLDDLSGHALIGYHPTLAASPAARWLEARAAEAQVVLRSREMTDMLAAASSGIGLALLPCLLGDTEPGLRRLTPAVLVTSPLALVYRREQRLDAAARAVIDFVLAVIAEHSARIRGAREGSA